MRRRTFPATGTDVFSAWERERGHLCPLPEPMPEPFDIAVTRRVGADCTVAFEGKTYSVPFWLVGRWVRSSPYQYTLSTHPSNTAQQIRVLCPFETLSNQNLERISSNVCSIVFLNHLVY